MPPETLDECSTRSSSDLRPFVWDHARTDIHPRIIKGTCWLAKRQQPGSDQLRVGLHIPEDPGQSGDQFVLAGEVAIMLSIFAGVLPQPLGGVEFGRVGRELVDFQPVAV